MWKRYVISLHTGKAYREWCGDVELRLFFTSTLHCDEWLASRPSRFTPTERALARTQLEAGWASA